MQFTLMKLLIYLVCMIVIRQYSELLESNLSADEVMESEPIITPKSFFGEKKKVCDIAIGTFSREIFSAVLEAFANEKIGENSMWP